MKAVKEYIKTTDRLFILLCVACSGLSVLALTSFAHDAASADSSFFANYRLPIVQAGAAALGWPARSSSRPLITTRWPPLGPSTRR